MHSIEYGSSKKEKNHHRHSCNYSIFHADFKTITSSVIDQALEESLPFEIFSKNLFLAQSSHCIRYVLRLTLKSQQKTKMKDVDAE